MLKHYAVVALRSAWRTPVASAINILTLTLGLVCFLVAYGVVGFWDRAEQHFANSGRTYVITTDVTLATGDSGTYQLPQSNPYVAKYLQVDFPAIESIARARVAETAELVSVDDRANKVFDVSVDPEFLTIFDLPFSQGDTKNALRQPRSAVLTVDAAKRLFGSENPMGRSILLRNTLEVTVTGVIRAIPEPSHMGRSATAALRFDMLTSMDVSDYFDELARNPKAPKPPENWLAVGVTTYVLLPTNGAITARSLGQQLPAFVARHAPARQLDFAKVDLTLTPVTHLLSLSNAGAFFLGGTGISVSMTLILLGTLVLAVACVNYASLATARATRRMRDVGLRKAYGALAGQVRVQYLLEAGVLTATALALALAIVAAVIPTIKSHLGIDIGLALFGNPATWFSLAAVVVLVSVAAGAYPAFILSRVRPILTLRTARIPLGRGSLAGILVGAQFTVACFLLIVVFVAYLQNQHLRRTGLGAESDPILVIDNDVSVTKVRPRLLRTELRDLSQVAAVGYAAWSPWTTYHVLALSLSPEETAVERPIFRYIVGDDFFSALQIPVIAGRALDSRYKDLPTAQGPWSVVVDRALVDEFNIGPPEQAVGRVVYIPKRLTAGFGLARAQPLRIVGVVETQPLAILGTAAHSTIYTYRNPAPILLARVSKNDVGGAVDAIKRVWDRLAPGVPIPMRFLDDVFNERYESFARISQIFAALTALAMLISAIGLCSMAILVSSARVREIGIRKIFGARTERVIALLLKGFSVPIVVANIVAWPLAFIAARAYLAAFIYPIQITLLPFVACLASTVAVSWLVVAAQTWRAASLKPADTLRAD